MEEALVRSVTGMSNEAEAITCPLMPLGSWSPFSRDLMRPYVIHGHQQDKQPGAVRFELDRG